MGKNDGAFYVYILYKDIDFFLPFYVGKGKGRRITEHNAEVINNRCKNNIKGKYIKAALSDHGYVPRKIVWCGHSEDDAFSEERRQIALYGRVDLGTGCLSNLTDGGEGVSGRTGELHSRFGAEVSAETRAKISSANKGRSSPNKGVRASDELRAKMSASAKARVAREITEGEWGYQMRGKTHSTKTRAAMSASHTGKKHRPVSDVARENLRNARLGKKASDSARMAMSDAGKRRWAKIKAEIS